VILLISLFIICLLVSNIAIAWIKGKISLGSFFYYFSDFSLCIIVLVNKSSLLFIKSRSRFSNLISSSTIPYS
jgi:hypothetical protein